MSSTLASNSIAHEDAITALTWTSENYIVSGSLDELVRIWDPKALDEPLFTSSTQDMAVVSLDSNESTVVSSSMDGILRVYSVAPSSLGEYRDMTVTTLVEREIECGPGMSWDVTLHPLKEHPLVATGSKTGGVSVYNYLTGELVASLSRTSSHFTLTTKFSPNGKLLVSTHQDGTIQIFNPQNGHCEERFSAGSAPLRALAFSACSRFFAVGSDLGLITIFSTDTMKQVGQIGAHSSRITALAFAHQYSNSTHSHILLSCSLDRIVSTWNITNCEKLSTLTNLKYPAWSAAISPDGSSYALGFDNGELAVFPID